MPDDSFKITNQMAQPSLLAAVGNSFFSWTKIQRPKVMLWLTLDMWQTSKMKQYHIKLLLVATGLCHFFQSMKKTHKKTLKTKETNMADLVEGPDRSKSQGRFGWATEELQNRHRWCQVFGRGVLQLHNGLCCLVDHHLTLVTQATLDEVKHWTARSEYKIIPKK